jgi:hypothetical protein
VLIDTPAGRIFAPSEPAAADALPLLDTWLSEGQFAKEMSVTLRTIRRWRALGDGPPYAKIGRTVRYRKSTARAWMIGCERDA